MTPWNSPFLCGKKEHPLTHPLPILHLLWSAYLTPLDSCPSSIFTYHGAAGVSPSPSPRPSAAPRNDLRQRGELRGQRGHRQTTGLGQDPVPQPPRGSRLWHGDLRLMVGWLLVMVMMVVTGVNWYRSGHKGCLLVGLLVIEVRWWSYYGWLSK